MFAFVTSSGPAWPVLAGLLPVLLFEYLRTLSPVDPTLQAPGGHFVVVSAASLLAAAIAAAVGVAGRRQRNIQVSFLSLGFMSLAFLFSLHGLSTPGLLMEPSHLPGASAQMSVLVASLWILFSSAPPGGVAFRCLEHAQRWLVPAWAAVMVAVVGAALRWPHLADALPVTSPPLSIGAAALTIGALVAAALRYWRSYSYSRFPLQQAIVYACAWLASAQWIMTNGTAWRLSWWIYHVELLAATAALVVGMIRQYGEGTSLADAVLGLFVSDPLKRLEMGLSRSVRALVLATEARDPYTAGHSLRVAMNAVRLGEAMGLSGDKLRALAQGGVVHDVGKIEIPDAILNKPGPLTPEERAIVQQHPVTGYRMCSRLGFMKDELDIVRYHHERWDGRGYPDGLAGERIPLLARVLAVVDVYDALTSARSYRGPWTHEQARTYILEQAGRQFDPRCVEAWARLTADRPLATPAPTRRRRPPAPAPCGSPPPG